MRDPSILAPSQVPLNFAKLPCGGFQELGTPALGDP